MPGAIYANVDSSSIAGWHKLINSCENGCKLSSHTESHTILPESCDKSGQDEDNRVSFNSRQKNTKEIEDKSDLNIELDTKNIFLLPTTNASSPKTKLPIMPPTW